MDEMKKNLASIQERMKAACEKSGRNLDDVRLLWVSKTKPIEAVQKASALGAVHFGENRIQEAIEKFSEKPANQVLHIIGPVQSNKLRKAAELGDWIHSISDLKKLRRIDELAGELGKKIKVLFQVNTSGEESKAGIPLSEAREWLESLEPSRNLLYSGLMTIPYNGGNPELNRKEFIALRELRDSVYQSADHFADFTELSMGMSADLEWAIEEGSTMIRVGTALFGIR